MFLNKNLLLDPEKRMPAIDSSLKSNISTDIHN